VFVNPFSYFGKDQQMELFLILICIPVYSYQSEKYLIQSYTNAYNQRV